MVSKGRSGGSWCLRLGLLALLGMVPGCLQITVNLQLPPAESLSADDEDQLSELDTAKAEDMADEDYADELDGDEDESGEEDLPSGRKVIGRKHGSLK